jgi:hypothetical protein
MACKPKLSVYSNLFALYSMNYGSCYVPLAPRNMNSMAFVKPAQSLWQLSLLTTQVCRGYSVYNRYNNECSVEVVN